jgi:hypothetical protein
MIQRWGLAMSDADRIQEMLKRQRMLSDFGAFALTWQNLDEGFSKACSLVADVLGTGRAKVLEIPPCGRVPVRSCRRRLAPCVVGQLSSPSAFAAGLRSSRSGFGQDWPAAERPCRSFRWF